MIEIRARQRSEMLEAHRAASRKSTAAKRPPARARNVDPILSIGESTYFLFRGRAYGVPPLPWRAGQKLLDAHMRALEATATLAESPFDKPARAEFYRAIAALAALLWRNTRPAGRFRRFVKAIGLSRNPFDKATDAEILEHADFFLARRMKSGVPSPQVSASLDRQTS